MYFNMEHNKQISLRANDYPALLEYADRYAPNFDAVSWSTTMSKLGRSHPQLHADLKQNPHYQKLVQTLSNTMMTPPTLSEFGSPRSISNIAHALAKLKQPLPNLMNAINDQASSLVSLGNPQDIANTAWAYRKLQYDAPTLLAAVDSASEVLIKSGKPQEISNVALAFAEIGHKPDSFFNCLEKHADEFVKSASEQAIINVSWSLVTLGLASENEALLQTLWKRAIETDASKLPREALLPLVQVDVHARTSGAKLPPAPPGLK